MDRQSLIQKLVARKLQSTTNARDLCWAGPSKALCMTQAARKALCFAVAQPKK